MITDPLSEAAGRSFLQVRLPAANQQGSPCERHQRGTVPNVRTYEHYVMELPLFGDATESELADLLDQCGEHGWRLVAVDEGRAFFRRPVIEGRK